MNKTEALCKAYEVAIAAIEHERLHPSDITDRIVGADTYDLALVYEKLSVAIAKLEYELSELKPPDEDETEESTHE